MKYLIHSVMFIALLLTTFTVALAESPSKPNFVIIMADDLGYNDIGCFGSKHIKTPHLDELAAQGIRFTDFHSSGPVCSPTRAGLLTGRYQQRAGVPGVINADPKVNRHHGLQLKEITFAERLKTAGYATGIVGKWHLGYQPKYNPTHQGFDRYVGYVSGNIDYHSHHDRMGISDWWHNDKLVEEEGYVTHLITKHAEQFITTHQEKPFCLYIAHEVPHTPNQGPKDPPVRVEGRVGDRYPKNHDHKRAYREMIEEMDKSVGAVVESLKAHGLEKNTLVMFFSDNGASRFGSNAPLNGSKGTLYEGGHRVPALAYWPGKIKPGQVNSQTIFTLDIAPTLTQLAGVKAKSDWPTYDGVSLTGLLLKGESLPERQLFWEFRSWQAMRSGDWKLVVHKRRNNKSVMLFNLKNDLGERNNLANAEPEKLKQMLKDFNAWEKDVTEQATPQPELKN